jgi:NAD(P)-dependent dehydrogenase (short-subunit alcohol dehydrogenase family)
MGKERSRVVRARRSRDFGERRTRVVAITGAAAGVGRATAREFARWGDQVGLVARSRESLENARREVEALGSRACVAVADVADPVQVEAAAAKIESELGPIDVWVNDGMVSVFSPFLEMTPEEFRRVTEVTYLGVVHGTRAALRRMVPRGDGVVIQVGSALSYRSIPLQSAYCGAKHAVAGFTESVRCELLHERSRVKICQVNLPAINTPQFTWSRSRLPRNPKPVGPIFQPEVPARAIYRVSRNPRRELEIGWPTLKAILVEKLAPALGDAYFARRGYELLLGDEELDLPRPDNLFEPLPGDFGAEGEFSSLARSRSVELWLRLHRGGLATAGAALLAGAFGFRRGRATLARGARSRRSRAKLAG